MSKLSIETLIVVLMKKSISLICMYMKKGF